MSNAAGEPTQPVPVPLAIVGIGCLFPRADSPEAFWANIKGGVDAVTDIPATHWNADDYFSGDPSAPDMTYSRRGAFLEPIDFNPLEFGITPNNIEATDTTQLLGLVVARQALRDAGYATGKEATDGRPFNRERTSVVLGVTGALELVIPLGARLGHPIWRRALKEAGVEPAVADDVVQRIGDAYIPWQENSFPGLLGNVAAGRIANRFDLGGSNCVVDAACASSLAALHMAALELYAGRSDMAITGGIDTFNDIFMYMCFSKTPALSPTGNSRPFSAGGDGTILGEGLGVVVLKRLADARRDGDRIHAILRGIGSSSDGKGNAVYAPSAEGQMRCLQSAYRESGVSPKTIELVEAHGTGTKVGDAVEAKALAEVYRNDQPDGTWCAVGSVKSMVGHTKAAAGIAGLIKAVLALDNKVLPPSIKVDRPLESIEPGKAPVYVNAQSRPWLPRATHPRRAAVSAFGFGGSNFHCVLEEANAAKANPDWNDTVLLLPVSADSPRQLSDRLVTLDAMTDWKHLRAESHRLRTAFRADSPCRLILVAQKDGVEFKKLVHGALHMLERHPERTHWSTPDGTCFASGKGSSAESDSPSPGTPGEGGGEGSSRFAGQLGIIFPGQGSQYTGMLRDLACQFPEFLDTLTDADTAFGNPAHGQRLSDRIYPISTFTDEAKAADERLLADTRIAQPAIGAVSLGAWRVLERFGVRADLTAGHSFGEITALRAAGRIDSAALHDLAVARGRAMGGLDSNDGVDPGVNSDIDRGSMLAVAAPFADVRSLLDAERLDLVIANRNAPDQVVLSGATPQIERAERLIHGRGMRCRRLVVSAAFHSPFVAAAREPFAAALAGVEFAAGGCPVFANTTAGPYPAGADNARTLLGRQIVEPVEFVAQIEAMYDAGARTFLEAGPGNKMAGLVRAILAGRDVHVLSVDASAGKRSGIYDLACVLAQLAVLGHPVHLAKWDESFIPPVEPAGRSRAGVMRLSGANHVKPRPSRPPVKRPVTAPAVPPPLGVAANGHPKATSRPPVVPDVRSDVPGYGSPKEGSARLNPTSPLTPAPHPSPPTAAQAVAAPAALSHALQTAQQSLLALQRMQEQTATLHHQYLSGQEQAQRTIHQLVEQQMGLLGAACGLALPPAQSPAPTTAPAFFAPVMPPAPMPAPLVAPPAAASSAAAPPQVEPRFVPEPAFSKTAPAAPARPAPAAPPVKQTSPKVSATPAAAPPLAAQSDETRQVLLEVVADKTGYPTEMLDLDMTLDSDLGIDSIKRVEILSALQLRLPAAPVVKPEDLGRIQTLRQIVDFLSAPVAAGAAGSTHRSAAQNVSPAQTASSAQPATAAHATQAPSDPSSSTLEETRLVLLEVVADKTGYPTEMLDLDMTLDSDLGIDSIKRVEILSALQLRLPAAPVVKPEDLGRIQTLGQIVQFLCPARGAAQGATAPEVGQRDASLKERSVTTEGVISEQGHRTIERGSVDVNRKSAALDRQVLTIVPLDTVPARAPLALSAGARVWITDDGGGLAAAVASELTRRQLRAEVVPLGVATGDVGRDVAGGPTLSGLLILAPAEPSPDFIRAAFQLIRHASPALREAGRAGAAFLAGASRLDGSFALNGHPPGSAVSGGLAGLVKTASHEWPEVACKSLDLPPGDALPPEQFPALAVQIVEELLVVGPPEVGLSISGPVSPQLVSSPLNGEVGQPALRRGDLVVVTGGARGVTAAVSIALAKTCGCNLLLLARSPEPTPEPQWLAGASTEAQIKKLIATREGGISPRALEDRFRRVMINREMLDTLRQIRATGAGVLYRPLDIRDPDAVAAAVAEARSQFGPVRGLVHGAGVLQDRLIEEKTNEQFDEVYSTKVNGLTALLAAVKHEELRAIVAFSSSTGRFGRRGQVAYAAANEVLNKLAQQEARRRPGCRVLSINWGPWEGGMVTPQLRRLFESEGVGLIPLEAGADYLMRELATPSGGPVEIVILGPNAAGTPAAPLPPAREPAVATRADASLTLAFERSLDLVNFPFLRSHVIKGRPVLPMAIILEWLAHGAMLENPGFVFHGIDDLRVFKGVVLDAHAPLPIQVLTGPAVSHEGAERVAVEMRSGNVLHARASVLLVPSLPNGHASELPPADLQYPAGPGEMYLDGRLFHGPDLQTIRSIEGWADESTAADGEPQPGGMIARVDTAPAPSAWMRQPLRSGWITDPLAIDAAFQLMILWCFETRGIGSLPTRAARYRQYLPAFPREGVRVAIRATAAGDHTAEATIEFLDTAGHLVAKIEGYECVMDATLKDAFAVNEL